MKYIVTFALIWMLCSCNTDYTKGGKQNFDALHSSANVQLILPDTIEIYNPYQVNEYSPYDSSFSYKLFYYANATCPSCLAVINELGKNSDSLLQKKIQIIVMCFSDNIFESFKFYRERGQFRQMAFPFYFDNKESLGKLNPKIDFQSEILLLDNKNRVIRGYNQSDIPFDELKAL